MLPTIGLLVAAFFGSLILDYSWANWTKAVVMDNVFKAMLWSCIYYSTVSFMILVLVECPWTIAPSVVGHMTGTYLALLGKKSAP